MTSIIIDAHVHLYPVFNMERVVNSAWAQLSSWQTAPDSPKCLLLTERSDCAVFSQIKQQPTCAGWQVQVLAPEAVLLLGPDRQKLCLLAGRQIVTAESLEVCCLLSNLQLPDRQFSTRETIRRVLQAGGVAALNWAPGKWLFGRGQLVAGLLNEFTSQELLIGDTSMRPTFWATPRLMQQAKRKGFRILAGSDPLPFSGEEENIGRYACRLQASWQEEQPVAALRQALTDPTIAIEPVGRRSAALEFIGRQLRIMREKKSRMA